MLYHTVTTLMEPTNMFLRDVLHPKKTNKKHCETIYVLHLPHQAAADTLYWLHL